MIYGVLSACSYFFQNLGNKEFGLHFPCQLRGIALLNALAMTIVAIVAGLVAGFSPLLDSRVWLMAMLFGVVYTVTIFLIVAALAMGPMGASTLILNMSMMIPVAVGLLVWHEPANLQRFIGIGAMVAVVLLSAVGGKNGGKKASAQWLAVVLLGTLSNGILTVIKKSQAYYFPQADSMAFTFWGFLLAALICWLVVAAFAARGERFGPWLSHKPALLRSVLGVGLGSALGNLIQMYGLSVGHADASILFPVAQGSLIIMLWLLSVLRYREPVRPCGVAGVILGVLGVVLLGIG